MLLNDSCCKAISATNLNYSIDKDLGVLLTWTAVTDIDIAQYEIRRGTSWSTATLISQVLANTYKIGSLDNGTYTYLVKAIDTSGVYSTNHATIMVTISLPNQTTITYQVQGGNLVLSWTAPTVTTYQIDSYRVTFGNVYSTSTEIALTRGTSFTIPVTWTGSRTFWVVPIDLVGQTAATQASCVVTISGAAAPTIEAPTFSGSQVTLKWAAIAGSIPTASYEIRRGSIFGTAAVLASVTATTYTFTATWLGTQTLWVVALDSNGNYGTEASVSVVIQIAPTPGLSATFEGQNLVLKWSAVKGSLDTAFYRVKRGSTYGAATQIATITGTAYTLRADWGNLETFWVAAVDPNGNDGNPSSVLCNITIPGTPTISQQVIDNNVLLRWNDVKRTLPINSYELRRGATWAAAEVIGTKQGGFTTVFESSGGTYTYWLAGIDSAGNYGTPSSVSALVNQPADYVLQLNQASTFTGTKVNMVTDATLGQVISVDTSETWQSHFTSRSWSTPQDQINAGYSYFLMPSTTSASYEEEFDYGTVLAGTKVTTILTTTNVAGSTTITPTIRTRGTTSTAGTYSQAGTITITVTSTSHGLIANDYVYLNFTSGTATSGTYIVVTATTNTFTVTASSSATTSGNVSWIKWISYAGVSEIYATAFRYFRIRYDFTSSGFDDLMLLTALQVRLDSKLKNDAGTGTANSADSGGTTVTFNIAFIDVSSISVTPLATTSIIAVYDFVDVPNPTSFKVLLFDTSGTRVSGAFSWSARGV